MQVVTERSYLDASTVDSAAGWAPIDAMIRDVVDRGLLSGAVTLAWHGGGLAHDSVIGWQDVATTTPMRRDTIFRLFSMTKPVMAAAMMILRDEGRWAPEDRLEDHLPELAGLQVLRGVDEDGVAILSPPRNPLLIEHVMTHRAGFTYGFSDEPVDRAFRAAGVPSLPHSLPLADYLARLARAPLAFDPGTGWRYGVAMDVQGALVERLSGVSLRDFMMERIFAPLGMVDTDFLVPEPKRDRFASLYVLPGDALVEASVDGPMPYDNMAHVPARDLVLPYERSPAFASGGGGLVSTAGDYLRFARMLLNRGELEGARILSAGAVAEMTRSHTPSDLLTGEFGTAPHVLRPGYEYAYNGVVVTDPVAADVRLGRDTYFWDGAAGCWFWIDPTNDIAFVCLIQLLADAERLSLQFRSRGLVADILSAKAGQWQQGGEVG
ncbi:beta-lactamase family protein [Sphingobium sp. 3R8]|uniref:serine hydrolase domain-containing protein n=1 Tax=Sphingobium sp. 3R8 TaxID=2874921 RepID=UPI001CCB6A65|nr:serine hydrolase domain-containing protein [Sphingobium sp. 3R8]MBZ9646307.1 beta-lactamase family protein [Sphingobium sp. 3R8]